MSVALSLWQTTTLGTYRSPYKLIDFGAGIDGYYSIFTEVSPMTTPTRKPYLTDLTDDQWQILQPLIPPAKPGGRPRAVDMRDIINTILYLNRTGCQWDMLPHSQEHCL